MTNTTQAPNAFLNPVTRPESSPGPAQYEQWTLLLALLAVVLAALGVVLSSRGLMGKSLGKQQLDQVKKEVNYIYEANIRVMENQMDNIGKKIESLESQRESLHRLVLEAQRFNALHGRPAPIHAPTSETTPQIRRRPPTH